MNDEELALGEELKAVAATGSSAEISRKLVRKQSNHLGLAEKELTGFQRHNPSTALRVAVVLLVGAGGEKGEQLGEALLRLATSGGSKCPCELGSLLLLVERACAPHASGNRAASRALKRLVDTRCLSNEAEGALATCGPHILARKAPAEAIFAAGAAGIVDRAKVLTSAESLWLDAGALANDLGNEAVRVERAFHICNRPSNADAASIRAAAHVLAHGGKQSHMQFEKLGLIGKRCEAWQGGEDATISLGAVSSQVQMLLGNGARWLLHALGDAEEAGSALESLACAVGKVEPLSALSLAIPLEVGTDVSNISARAGAAVRAEQATWEDHNWLKAAGTAALQAVMLARRSGASPARPPARCLARLCSNLEGEMPKLATDVGKEAQNALVDELERGCQFDAAADAAVDGYAMTCFRLWAQGAEELAVGAALPLPFRPKLAPQGFFERDSPLAGAELACAEAKERRGFADALPWWELAFKAAREGKGGPLPRVLRPRRDLSRLAAVAFRHAVAGGGSSLGTKDCPREVAEGELLGRAQELRHHHKAALDKAKATRRLIEAAGRWCGQCESASLEALKEARAVFALLEQAQLDAAAVSALDAAGKEAVAWRKVILRSGGSSESFLREADRLALAGARATLRHSLGNACLDEVALLCDFPCASASFHERFEPALAGENDGRRNGPVTAEALSESLGGDDGDGTDNEESFEEED